MQATKSRFLSRSVRIVTRAFRFVVLGALLVIASIFAVRAYDAHRGDPLQIWHQHVPDDVSRAQMERMNWDAWIAAENNLFMTVEHHIAERLPAEMRRMENRYFSESPINPNRFAVNWNRSFILKPDHDARGVAVLLHGLTDGPYSMRHLAQFYRLQGFVAIVIRMPGHGTVPAGLTATDWEDWMAATLLAMREARLRVPHGPLHLVGYSNGGALAVKYALDALANHALAKPDRLVLISPMIGVTEFARFAGLAALPAFLPAFERAAWLSVLPEFNPFKYNSFPVAAAVQSHRLTQALQAEMRKRAADGSLAHIPPILTFQSVVDFTVRTDAIFSRLYAHLPKNGSELVLFDINQGAKLGPLLHPRHNAIVDGLLSQLPLSYQLTLITNRTPSDSRMAARIVEAGGVSMREQTLAFAYPAEMFSLSHVALPFPLSDGLYGLAPDPRDYFGISLGALAARGEIGALLVNLDSLMRVSSNPFFPFIEETIAASLRL